MRKGTWLAAVGLVALGIASLAAGCSGANKGTLENLQIPSGVLQQTGIWVTGEGKVTATPDIAMVTLGIEAQATTVTEAQQQARTSMDAVMKALKSNGIKDNDIQTQSFSITPIVEFHDKDSKQVIVGYRVSNIVIAKVRRVQDAGPVIDAVAEAGGDLTRINSIAFTIDDPSALNAKAEQAALKDAQARARSVADTMNVKLGKLTYIQVSGTGFTPPSPIFLSKEAGAALPPTSISPGEISVRATASASWEIE